MRSVSFALFLVSVFILNACGDSSDQSEPIAISSVAVHTDLFGSELATDSLAWQKMYQSYGRFYPLLVEDILHVGPADQLSTYQRLTEFVEEPFQKRIYEVCDSVFPSSKLNELDEAFRQSFGNWQALQIDSIVPDIFYFHGGFNFGVISKDSVMGVGLEWWLGSDTKEYRQLPFPKYRVQKMKPEHLLPNAMKDWIAEKTGINPSGENLLHYLVHYGKVMYLTQRCLPDMPAHEIMNLSSEQTRWLVDHEDEIWDALAKQEVLFGSRPFDIQKWFVDGPNTGPLPQESPPMAGIWMGWQIVNDYMKSADKTTPKQLLEISPEVIVARYKPGN